MRSAAPFPPPPNGMVWVSNEGARSLRFNKTTGTPVREGPYRVYEGEYTVSSAFHRVYRGF